MEKVCGLDVHKDSIFACILDAHGKKVLEERFRTTTRELTTLWDKLVIHGTNLMEMESTSMYWMPLLAGNATLSILQNLYMNVPKTGMRLKYLGRLLVLKENIFCQRGSTSVRS